MPIFDMECAACGDVHEEWSTHDKVKDGIPCPACGNGTKTIKLCAAFIPTVPKDGVWRTEVRSKDVGELASRRYAGEDLRVVNDGSRNIR